MSKKSWKERKSSWGRMPLPTQVGHAIKSKKYRYLQEIEEEEREQEIEDWENGEDYE